MRDLLKYAVLRGWVGLVRSLMGVAESLPPLSEDEKLIVVEHEASSKANRDANDHLTPMHIAVALRRYE